MKPIAYGVDYGTTNSVIAAAFEDGSTEVVSLSSQYLESIISIDRTGQRLAGEQAITHYTTVGTGKTLCSNCDIVTFRPYSAETHITDCRAFEYEKGSCTDARLLAHMKSYFTDDSFYLTHSWGVDFTISSLASIVISRLKKSADRTYECGPREVVVGAFGTPTKYVGASTQEEQDSAANKLREAAALSGFTEVYLVPEAQAVIALEGVTDGIVLSTDFGGGTFDCSVIDYKQNVGHVLTIGGVEVGGESFDSKIFQYKIEPILLGTDLDEIDPRNLEDSRLRDLRTITGLQWLIQRGRSTNLYKFGVQHGRGRDLLQALISGGASPRLFDAIKKAKHDLCTLEESSISTLLGGNPIDIPLTRSDFEALIEADIDKVIAEVTATISRAKVDPQNISTITTTGGSSLIPLFQEKIRTVAPNARLVEMNPFDTVARGLAEYAFETMNHA